MTEYNTVSIGLDHDVYEDGKKNLVVLLIYRGNDVFMKRAYGGKKPKPGRMNAIMTPIDKRLTLGENITKVFNRNFASKNSSLAAETRLSKKHFYGDEYHLYIACSCVDDDNWIIPDNQSVELVPIKSVVTDDKVTRHCINLLDSAKNPQQIKKDFNLDRYLGEAFNGILL